MASLPGWDSSQAGWSCERDIRAAAPAPGTGHLPDAEVLWPSIPGSPYPGQAWAIEVELTPKPAARVTRIIAGLLSAQYAQVVYLVSPAAAPVVEHAAARFGAEQAARITIRPLPPAARMPKDARDRPRPLRPVPGRRRRPPRRPRRHPHHRRRAAGPAVAAGAGRRGHPGRRMADRRHRARPVRVRPAAVAPGRPHRPPRRPRPRPGPPADPARRPGRPRHPGHRPPLDPGAGHPAGRLHPPHGHRRRLRQRQDHADDPAVGRLVHRRPHGRQERHGPAAAAVRAGLQGRPGRPRQGRPGRRRPPDGRRAASASGPIRPPCRCGRCRPATWPCCCTS
jgi:hypothetical protein